MNERAEIVDLVRAGMPVKGVKFYGPSAEDELIRLQELVSDELILDLYRITAGCIVVNEYGEIRLYSIKEIITKAMGKNTYIGMIPIGTIKDVGDLYVSSAGTIKLFYSSDKKDCPRQWESIESLLQINLKMSGN